IEYIYTDLLYGEWIGLTQSKTQMPQKLLAEERIREIGLDDSALNIPGSKIRKGIFKYVPSKETLRSKFSYYQNNNLMYPIALIHFGFIRIFKYDKKQKALRKIAKENDERRLSLLKAFEIINGDKL
ncbi:MAG: hypothetical protein J6I80_00895, partial [Clostridia bacterium]|nr:hypothetical protein [Clostridia bacterium]